MKKITVVLMISLVCIMLCACGGQIGDTTATEQVAHTLPASAQTSEPEWCNIDCDINLMDGDVIYISSEDFDTFALVGSDDSDCCIKLKLSSAGTDMLKSYAESGLSELTLTVNGKNFAQISLDENSLDGEFDVSGCSFEELCEWANIIRGI